MAKTKISEYDATAGNNTDIDSINISEGMLPSNVNNSFRALLSHLSKMNSGTDALTSPQLTSVDINGGTIDGAIIGGSSAAAISGTTLALSGNADLNGALDVATTALVTGVLTTTAATVFNGGFASNAASTITDDLSITGATPTFQMADTSVSNNVMDFVYDETFLIDIDPNNARGSTAFQIDQDGTQAFKIDDSRNAAFAGTITAAGGAGTYNNNANVLTLNGSQHTRLLIDTSSSAGHQAGLTLESNGRLTNFANTGSNSTIANDIGNFTIDSAANIVLDAGSGEIIFKVGGTSVGRFFNSSGNFYINSPTINTDMIFQGNDGNADVTALTFDMSEDGAASFSRVFKLGADATNAPYFNQANMNTLNAAYGSDNDTADMWINYVGYQGGASRFRDFRIGNGKQAAVVLVDGSSSDVTFSGNIIIGTNGKGIDFSAQTQSSSTTTSELLDHYEEGTWTPQLLQVGTSTQVNAYYYQVGSYVRIGQVVHIQGRVQANGLGSASGAIVLGNLPFTSSSSSNNYSALCIGYANGLNITAGHSLVGTIEPGSTFGSLRVFDISAGTTDLGHGELSADGGFIFSGTYHV